MLDHPLSDWSKVQSPIACDMSVLTRAQRETHLTTSRELFSKVRAIKELADGYEFQFGDEPEVIVRVAEFVALEKLCCPFLNFAINIEAEGGPVTLRLTGREGVKAFVREEISGLLGNVIEWKQDEGIGGRPENRRAENEKGLNEKATE